MNRRQTLLLVIMLAVMGAITAGWIVAAMTYSDYSIAEFALLYLLTLIVFPLIAPRTRKWAAGTP